MYRRAQDFGLLNERSISGIVDELKPCYVGQSGLPHCTSVDAHGNAHANCMVATTTRASLPASRGALPSPLVLDDGVPQYCASPK